MQKLKLKALLFFFRPDPSDICDVGKERTHGIERFFLDLNLIRFIVFVDTKCICDVLLYELL